MIVKGSPRIDFNPYRTFMTKNECVKYLKENDKVLIDSQVKENPKKGYHKGAPPLNYFFGQCVQDPTRKDL